jgi:hypothetical protein
LVQSAFLIVPTDDPAGDANWEKLDRAGRMAFLARQLAELGALIRARLGGLELEYLEGAGAWTARSDVPREREELVEKLRGLPVEVATDDRFYPL